MKKNEEVKDKTRNNRFVEAFDYLRRNSDVTTRKQLADMMGVNKDTITRIMHAYTPLTEEAITKFQAATGCIFNLQWLRGESDVMLAKDGIRQTGKNQHQSSQGVTDGDAMKIALAAKQETIDSLNNQLADKEKIIKMQNQRIAELEAELADQNQGEKMPDKRRHA